MNKGILLAAAIGAALSAAAVASGASAMSVTPSFSPAVERAAPVQKTAVYCGLWGCGPIWPGPRPRDQRWGPWGHIYRPACPLDYYYACRRGPLGYGQCACWPYRRW